MEDEKNFKKHLKMNEYDKCIDIIRNKIIMYVVLLIKKTKKEYTYSDIIDLIDTSNTYLEGENRYIASKIDYFSIEEDEACKLNRLLNICKVYNIKI